METKVSPVLAKGSERYRRFQIEHAARFGGAFSGRLLDFGCGAGGFLIAAAEKGIDVHGVEVDADRQAQFLDLTAAKPGLRSRFNLYPGRLFPFPSNHFDGAYSWFVFEHVADPQVCLREIVRTLKPGGTLSIHADDTRNAWDGHAIMPWPSYLPREFAGAYADGLGIPERTEFLTKYVVYISAPVVCDILTTLGMEIVYVGDVEARSPVPGGLYVTSEDEARELGRTVRASGTPGPAAHLKVFARKR